MKDLLESIESASDAGTITTRVKGILAATKYLQGKKVKPVNLVGARHFAAMRSLAKGYGTLPPLRNNRI